MKLKPGDTFNAMPPIGGGAEVYKVHVVQVIDEGRAVIKENDPVRIQVVYRCFGNVKKWWHYFICPMMEFEGMIERYKKFGKGKEQAEV